MSSLSEDTVHSWFSMDQACLLVQETVNKTASSDDLIRFISWYANLNSWFGSGVASLAGKIGRSRHIFFDGSEIIRDIGDRSVYVASFFFDAARDEFDDRDTNYRDTHRCLAQACIKGIAEYYFNTATPKPGTYNSVELQTSVANLFAVNSKLTPPAWMSGISEEVCSGYGVYSPDSDIAMFRSMGYHLGSEILADQEFTIIDRWLKDNHSGLVSFLKDNKWQIAGQEHGGYSWVGLHSGDGSAKEVEHFMWATQGIKAAFKYTDMNQHTLYMEQVKLGFQDFVRVHAHFFGACLNEL